MHMSETLDVTIVVGYLILLAVALFVRRLADGGDIPLDTETNQYQRMLDGGK